MMPLLHDPEFRALTKERIARLTPGARRQWGKMTVDQMLHHVNLALETALGRVPVKRLKFPLPAFLVKFLVLNAPWPRSAPTPPEWVAGERYDFEVEQARCLALIDEVTARPLHGSWPTHSSFGDVGGTVYSRLQAKHLNHHLHQFSA